MRLQAHAKVNIGLLAEDLRDDGYHNIKTYMAKVELADFLEVSIEPSTSLSVSLEGNDYLHGEQDLMEKAAYAFYSFWGIGFALSVRIEKHIPLQAGLGGGSSDAAVVLQALSSYFSKPLPVELSARVGSDVPFLASGYSAAFCTGRGEILTPCQGFTGQELYILVPEDRVATRAAFNALDSIARPFRNLPALGSCAPSREVYPNDFELVYKGLRPEALLGGPFYCSLTGSGSGWFAITSSLDECLLTSAGFDLHRTRFI